MITPVVLCGVAAKKLDPFVTNHLDVECLQGLSELGAIESTLDSIRDHRFFSAPIIITQPNINENIKHIIKQQNLEQYCLINNPTDCSNIISVALAAFKVMKQDKEGMMLIMPDDKLVLNKRLLKSNLSSSTKFANDNKIVLFSRVPNNMSTQYGYIKLGNKIQEQPIMHQMLGFVNNPSMQRTIRFVKGGEYEWYTELFLCKARVFLEEFEKYNSKLYFGCLKAFSEGKSLAEGFVPNLKQEFDDQHTISSVILENTSLAVTVQAQFKWINLGDWFAIKNNLPKDEGDNTLIGNVHSISNKDCLIINDSSQPIAAIGVKDLMIVRHKNVTAVVAANRLQELPQLFSSSQLQSASINNNLINNKKFSVDNIVLSTNEEYSLVCNTQTQSLNILQGTLSISNNGKEEAVEVGQNINLKPNNTYLLTNKGQQSLNVLLVSVDRGSQQVEQRFAA